MNRTTARRLVSSYLEEPVARFLSKLGFTPNAVTLSGLVVAGGASYLLSAGYLWAGGVVLLFAGIFDLFDGALARMTNRVSSFGALLDSVSDRVSEVIILLGLLIYYTQQSSTEGVVLVYLALAGSIMVSYLRARSEGLGIDCKVGVMTRPERVAALGIGLVIGNWWETLVLIVLGVIAGLTMFTSIQRLYHTWRSLNKRQ